ncbi:MAG: hypothetical protein AB1553_12355 [Nitrospirota bacterium]
MPSKIARLAVFLVLITYIVTPCVDSIACDDCKGVAPFQGVFEQGSNNSSRSEKSPSIEDNTTQSTSPVKERAQFVCSICLSPIEGFNNHYFKSPFSVVSLVNQSAINIFLEPSFPIIKPPQN